MDESNLLIKFWEGALCNFYPFLQGLRFRRLAMFLLSGTDSFYSLPDAFKEFNSLPDESHNGAFDEFAPLSLDWIEKVRRKS
jgi:hypothetical protein